LYVLALSLTQIVAVVPLEAKRKNVVKSTRKRARQIVVAVRKYRLFSSSFFLTGVFYVDTCSALIYFSD